MLQTEFGEEYNKPTVCTGFDVIPTMFFKLRWFFGPGWLGPWTS